MKSNVIYILLIQIQLYALDKKEKKWKEEKFSPILNYLGNSAQ